MIIERKQKIKLNFKNNVNGNGYSLIEQSVGKKKIIRTLYVCAGVGCKIVDSL